MFSSLRRLCKAAISDYQGKLRTEWVTAGHPSQVILTISQIMWCRDLTKCLKCKALRGPSFSSFRGPKDGIPGRHSNDSETVLVQVDSYIDLERSSAFVSTEDENLWIASRLTWFDQERHPKRSPDVPTSRTASRVFSFAYDYETCQLLAAPIYFREDMDIEEPTDGVNFHCGKRDTPYDWKMLMLIVSGNAVEAAGGENAFMVLQ
ncbi:hypothetical protein STEG23_031118, partial [Scotinomys teguina]